MNSEAIRPEVASYIGNQCPERPRQPPIRYRQDEFVDGVVSRSRTSDYAGNK